MRTESIVMPLVTGRCRWCQITRRGGAEWTDPRQTLCVPCGALDAYVRTPAGRRFIARLVQPLLDAARQERRPRRRRSDR